MPILFLINGLHGAINMAYSKDYQLYFSISTKGFYDTAVNSISSLPSDVVGLSKDAYLECRARLSAGEIPYVDQNGILKFDPRPDPTEEYLSSMAKSKRDQLLMSTDWVVVKASEDKKAVSAAWKTYRQALRDITDQEGFPSNIVWPEKPE